MKRYYGALPATCTTTGGGGGAGVVVVVVVVSVSICPLVISTTKDITHKHASLSTVKLTNRNAEEICAAPTEFADSKTLGGRQERG